jgi:hypothetical protein
MEPSNVLDRPPPTLLPSLHDPRVDQPPIIHLPPARIDPTGRLRPAGRVEKVLQVRRVCKDVAGRCAAGRDEAPRLRFTDLSSTSFSDASADRVSNSWFAMSELTCSIVVELRNINYNSDRRHSISPAFRRDGPLEIPAGAHPKMIRQQGHHRPNDDYTYRETDRASRTIPQSGPKGDVPPRSHYPVVDRREDDRIDDA